MMLLLTMWAEAWAEPPEAWYQVGTAGYTVETSEQAHDGERSVVIRGARKANDFGGIGQTISANRYQGKRVRMTVWLRTQDVTGWAGAWFRVDREGSEVAFDNMQQRSLSGTQPWAQHSLVLDVPKDAEQLVYGALLSGKAGSLWVDDLRLEVVDRDVPVTDMLVEKKPTSPQNLGFEE